jgi:hypothetical protein
MIRRMQNVDSSADITADQWARLERIKGKVVPGRSCGTCSLCCKVVRVPEMDNAAGTWCRHARPGNGCGIYATRPFICRSAYCEWMATPAMGPEWKPEIAKFVLYRSQGGKRLSIHVDPGAPDAWRRTPYYENIKRWATEAAWKTPDPHMVDVLVGERSTVILPDDEVELGVLAPDEQVRIGRTFVEGGVKVQVDKVKRVA